MRTIGLLVILLLVIQTQTCIPHHGGGGDHCDHIFRQCLDGCKRFNNPKQYWPCQGVCLTACLGCKAMKK